MRSLVVVLSAVLVMVLAFWAYRENYRTQAELAQNDEMRREIGQLREQLNVLKAEWAYLNRPERLRELAEINFDRLQLLPLAPEQFGLIGQVSYPLPDQPAITDPVDTVAPLHAEEQNP
jgi:hypothetical protein